MNNRFLIGKQTTKGTAEVTTMHKLDATTFNVRPSVSKVESKAIGAGRWAKDGFVGSMSVSGDVTIELTTGQLEMFLLGAGFESKGVKSTKHQEILPADSIEQYLTIVNDYQEDDLHEVSQDCLVSSLEINAQTESYVNMSANIIGMNHEIGSTKLNITPVALKGSPLICLGAKLIETTTDMTAKIDNFSLTIDNKLEGKKALNSVYFKSIRQSDRGTVSISIGYNEFDKATYIKAQELLKKNTSYKVEIELAETEDNTKKVKILLPIVKVSNTEVTDLEGAGGMSKDMDCYYDESIKSPIKITLENYNTTVTP